MRIFVRLKKAESRAPIAYYKCEQPTSLSSRSEAPRATDTSGIDCRAVVSDVQDMKRIQNPTPPKACPVCRVAMQTTQRDGEIVHRCERCLLTITVELPRPLRAGQARHRV